MPIVVALSGSIASGKTTLAKALTERWGGEVVSTRTEIERIAAERSATLRHRRDFQEFGDQLDRETHGNWVSDSTSRTDIKSLRLLVIDAVRTNDQVATLRERYGRAVVHVHLVTNNREELARRYRARNESNASIGELESYDELSQNQTEADIDNLARNADIVLDTLRNTEADLLVRCEAQLGLLPSLTTPLVDVLVGGQYGSEGKGNVAYYLGPEYDVLVRVGGPNAGHKVKHGGQIYTHRSLPSGSLANPKAQLIIGPGAVVSVPVLMDELSQTGLDPARVHIDPQVMVITAADLVAEANLKQAIGSTGQGGGAAAARRILGRGSNPARLARDIDELSKFIAPTAELLHDAFEKDKRVFVEGTQGTGLSLYHGSYPHVTSRDTTVAGTLAEVGIGPGRVRRSVMVVRTYPIRVGGPSGPIGHGR